jgi:hypothetical protein
MASTSNGSAGHCPTIDPSPVVDVTYFIQMIPCTDATGKRQAILRDFGNGKNGKNGKALKLPAPRPARKGDAAAWGHGIASKLVVTPGREKALKEARKQFLADPWLFTGRAFGQPYWSIGIEYAQTWTHLGLRRGRIVEAVPLGLHPASRDLSTKTWEKRVVRSQSTDALEEARNTEVGGAEKFSLAVKKQTVNETNSTYNPSATINSISIPIQGSAEVGIGGGLGVSSVLANLNRNTLDRGSDFVQDVTFRSIETVKTTRTLTVETTVESGFETNSRETLANPNRCNTLNYLFYELVDDVQIVTRPSALDLYLFLPLPFESKVTAEWLVANECYLRPLVPCEKLAEGFDAARRLITLTRLKAVRKARALAEKKAAKKAASSGAGAGGAAAPGDEDLARVVDRVEAALTAYRSLSGADQTERFIGRWAYWELVKIVSERIVDAFEKLNERWSASSFKKENAEQVAAAIEGFKGDIGDIDMEFGKVNAAIGVFTGIALLGGPVPFGMLIVAAIIAVGAACDALGLDVVPDDAGLERKSEQMVNSADILFAAAEAVVPTAPPSATGAGAAPGAAGAAPAYDPIEAQKIVERLRAEEELVEEMEARTAFMALRHHVLERIHFYHQAIWSRYDSSWIAQRLLNLGVPPGLFELRFRAYEGEHGAIRLADPDMAKKLGFDYGSLAEWRKMALQDPGPRRRMTVSVPAPGAVVEPLLGSCNGADEFVLRHRALDLARAEAERLRLEANADLARAEVKRLEARIAAGLLDDPSPFGRATHLSIELETNGAAPQLPTAPAAPAAPQALAPPQGAASGASGPS